MVVVAIDTLRHKFWPTAMEQSEDRMIKLEYNNKQKLEIPQRKEESQNLNEMETKAEIPQGKEESQNLNEMETKA